MSTRTVHILVDGLVQGVGYRWWTVGTARGLGLDGWVRNLDDGRVEILARGAEAEIAELAQACHAGPPSADVDAVQVEPRAPDQAVPRGFAQRPTADAPI